MVKKINACLIIIIFYSMIVYSENTYAIIVYNISGNNNVVARFQNFQVSEKNEVKQIIIELFANILELEYNEININLIPSETEIQSIFYEKGHLTINFSEEVLNYGGNTWENYMINQLLSLAFSVDKVNYVTFLINGEKKHFVEGTIIDNLSRDTWNERMKILWNELTEEKMTN